MSKRIALITGASRGIGAAIAARFKDGGIEVLTPSRQEMNLLSNTAIDAYVDSLKKPVDIVVNNAGINIIEAITVVRDESINETVQTNLLAPLRIIKKVAPIMMQRKYGRIVNISSIWGTITKPKRAVYSLTKSGLNGLTRTLAVELAPYNILVNCVAPGYVNTELTKKNNTAEELEYIKKTIPLNRLAEPTEIAELVAFLSSEVNTYITGQVVVADGGFTCL